MLFFRILPALAVAIGSLLLSRRLLHYFQLESYQFHGFFKTLNRQAGHALFPGLVFGICVFIILFLGALIPASPDSAGYAVLNIIISLILIAISYILHKRILRNGKEKKPFRVTARIKRLIGALAVVLIFVCCLRFIISGDFSDRSRLNAVILSLVPLFLPLWVTIAALLALPIEKLIYELYFRDARKKLLANDRLIRIGITGSYGKTSTKFILSEMLSQKYNVLATPASFNTPMGITSIIRTRLTPAHQVFIAEMGARHPQDIRELCRLVHPTIGVLTSVGPQHLDTFHTIENIKNTKYDLIRALPDDGLAVFANDDAIVTELYTKTEKPAKLFAGCDGSDAWASDVSVNANGSSFILHLPDHNPIACTTPLLGKHNIANIVLSAALASKLGVSDRQLQTAISQLKPVEHRMNIVSTANGVTVIDDAFNTNPVSSKLALDVLKMFTPRRIIVTPGMVELGADEARFNREFGEYMADCVDQVFLVGKNHTAPIVDGLMEKGFDSSSIHVFNSLDEAVRELKSFVQPGDTVMYENDLPDSYSEGV